MFAIKLVVIIFITNVDGGSKSVSQGPCQSENCTTIIDSKCNECAVTCDRGDFSNFPEDIPKETGCLMINGNVITNLSANDIPDLPKLTDLDLSQNKIATIEDETFVNVSSTLMYLRLDDNGLHLISDKTFAGLIHLRNLNIANNWITKIYAGAFDDLENLKYLRMGNNKLVVGEHQSLPHGIFLKMCKLQYLDIKGNNVTGLTYYRGDLLQNLTKLTELQLDGISNGTALPEEFQKLSSLKKLRIYGKEFNMILNDTFANLAGLHLLQLNISSTSLELVEVMSFSHLISLQELIIIKNNKLGLCEIRKTWRGLQQTHLKKLILNRIVSPYLDYNFLPCKFFDGFGSQLKNIKTVHMEGNNLIVIDDQISSNLTSLENLSLDFNRFQSIHTLQCSKEMGELTYPPKEHPMCFKSCTNFTRGIAVENVPTDSQEWDSGILRLPKSIRNLRVSAATRFDAGILSEIKIIGCSNLESITLRKSNIVGLEGPVQFVGNVARNGFRLDFRNNALSYIAGHFFRSLSVRFLDLGWNALGVHLSKDRAGATFQYCNSLETLDISKNGVYNLPQDVFSGLTNLMELNLSGNYMTHFTAKISHMQNLRYIDLRRNLFIVLSPETTDLFDKFSLSVGRQLVIDLRSNTLVCSCDTLEFLNWVLNDNTTVKSNYRYYFCLYGKDKEITFGEYEDAYRLELIPTCYSKTYLVVTSVMAVATLLTLTVTVVAYRHRWDIKFFIIRCYKRKQWKEFLRQEDGEVYEFRAFVAYHDDDILWVRNELLRNLENTTTTETNRQTNSAFKLCVHDRDFLPGASIEDNILEGIRSSKKCIVVLTRSFLTSSWCEFELRMARLNCFDRKKNTIIVVMLEPLPNELLTPSFVAFIRRTTILEWSQSPMSHPLFWDKLRQALTSDKLTPLICECGRSIRQRWSTRMDSHGQVGHFHRTMSLN